MKNREQIESKIKESRLYESECEIMATCVECDEHPDKLGYKLETFHDIDRALRVESCVWMDKACKYMEVADALEWVLKDE